MICDLTFRCCLNGYDKLSDYQEKSENNKAARIDASDIFVNSLIINYLKKHLTLVVKCLIIP